MVVLIADNIGSMGGTRTFFENLLVLNSKNSIRTIVVLQKNNTDKRIEELVASLGFSIFRLHNRSVLFTKPYFSLIYDFYVYLKIRLELKPDLIFCSIGKPKLFICFFLFNTPLIYFLHTIPFPASWKTKPIDFFSRFASPSKIFVSVSNFARLAILDLIKIDESFIEIIPNCVSIPNRTLELDEKRSFSVLTVGHLVEYKNPFVWYEVAKKVINDNSMVTFLWVGEGPLLKPLQEKIITEGFSESIKLMGLRFDLDFFYRNSSIYFHPSKLESQGITVLEAMSYKLPVVASNVGGIPESVESGITGFLHNPDDVEGFASSISYLLSNKDLTNFFGSNGYNRILNFFSSEFYEKKILELYMRFLPK